MYKRSVVGGVLGGVVLFIWQSIAHMVLPLGEAGIKRLGNEDAVIAALRGNIEQPGFYIFPAPEEKPGMSTADKREAMRKAEEKYRTGPSGILIFHPQGGEALTPRQLVTQLVLDILALFVGAWLLAQATGLAFGGRILFVTLLGLLPVLVVNLPDWNWYGFPATYTLAQLAEHVIGLFAAGLVVAKIINPGLSPRPV